MSSETEPIRLDRPTIRPDGFGRSFIVSVPDGVAVESVLDRIASVWRVVAKWGHWWDEELGDWPETAVALQQLPFWFAKHLSAEPDGEVENWMDDLHDREWWWWSGAVVGGMIKIDIASASSPISTWMLEYVVEKAGGTVTRRGDCGAALQDVESIGG